MGAQATDALDEVRQTWNTARSAIDRQPAVMALNDT